MAKKRTKDLRVAAKRGMSDFADMLERGMNGTQKSRAGAEEAGFEVIRLTVQLFLMHEGAFPDALRTFVGGLMNEVDPLRRDIPGEQFHMLWPTLNTLVRSRAQAVQMRTAAAAKLAVIPTKDPLTVSPTITAAIQEAAHGRPEETRSEVEGPTPGSAGAGAVGDPPGQAEGTGGAP